MQTVLTILHVLVCGFLILVVLLQAGKGGGMGIAFGGGGSQTVFGSSGAGNFLTRLTAICATIFFINSLALAYLSSQQDSKRLRSLGDRQSVEKQAKDAANAKVAKDLEQARKQIEQASAPKAATPAAVPPATETKTETTKSEPAKGAAGKAAAPKGEAAKSEAAPAEGTKPKRPVKKPKPADESAAPAPSETPPAAPPSP